MQWCKLIDWKDENLWRGTVFRLPVTALPHEAPVDLMLIETVSSASGFSLMVCTGYKAGLMLFALPESAKAEGAVHAISRNWLVSNWKAQIYPACPVEVALLMPNYPAGL